MNKDDDDEDEKELRASDGRIRGAHCQNFLFYLEIF